MADQRHLRSTLRLVISGIIAAALSASAAVQPAAAQSLIGVDFGEGVRPLLFEGVEPQAAALDPLFAAADVWNELIVSANFGQATTNPSFGSLVDNTGATTAVSFAITGAVSSFNSVGFFGRPNPDGSLSLQGDYLYFNGNQAPNPSIDWRISGLTPGAVYRLVLYGANTNANRAFTMLVDTDGDGDLTDEVASQVTTLNNATPAPVYLAAVVASASGAIVGRGSGSSGEADWAGFQLLFVGSPTLSIEDVLELFDQAVADGTLVGQGPGNSARGRLNALRNMLLAAGALLAQGNVEAACSQLQDVANRTDGAFPPPDFVQGTAAADLFDAVTAFQAQLGCVQ